MLTDVRDTREIEGRYRVFEAAAAIFCGALVAINAAGKAVPARQLRRVEKSSAGRNIAQRPAKRSKRRSACSATATAPAAHY